MVTFDPTPLPNILGCLALASYIVTLLPTILRIVFPQTKGTGVPQWLLKRRRIIGIIAFCFALAHGCLFIEKRNIDFADPKTFLIYFQGITTLTIFTILAITSNDWSVKKLKKNWKQLHKLTYIAMFLLTWHIWDKMKGHWTHLTPIVTVAITGVSALFLLRLWIERKNQPQKKLTAKSPGKLQLNSNR